MTYTSIGYICFFTIMTYVIGVIGWQFYKHGRHFLESIFKTDLHLIDSINKLLLVGYYLFNLGYVAISIRAWVDIKSWPDLISTIAVESGTIILILGVMHYLNLFWLSHFYQFKSFLKSISTHKN